MEKYFKSGDFVQNEQVPDAVLSDEDLRNPQVLAGLQTNNVKIPENLQNISHTAMEKKKFEKENNIQPGTPEWFKLWFTLPYLTNTKPYNK